ncbi:MAG TPA: F0F1 ATP synthase subunit delta [Steroidobacteraceae bacterium]|nr:F0F1 ATP synthase subunit delta [Steroidobacteraceae bacterium]
MADRATIARPYAKAAFEHAREARSRDPQAFAKWSRALALAAQIVADARVAEIIKNPELTAAEHAGLIAGVAGAELDASMQNFVALLAENRRLTLLPEIAAHYEGLRAEVENTVDVEVISAVPLDASQAGKLERALAQRLKRTVRMHTSVDPALVGGALIRAGDLVIDGSLRGRLERLGTELTS